MPLEQVQFQPNIPQVLCLKYDEPKRIEKTGNYMVSIEDGRVVFLKPDEAAEFMRFKFRRGDPVSFKRVAVMSGNRMTDTRWEFLPAELAHEPAPPQAAKPEGGAVRAASLTITPGSQGQCNMPAPSNGNGHAAHNGIPYWEPKTELLRCYSDAIDVLVAARETAAGKGLPVQFTGEDLRQVAATLYIDAGKDRRTPWQGR